jgi:DNA invertase Pin-like site-specific DNA recombinase
MAEDRWISYLRVSTGRQGKSGLGIEAQRSAVDVFLNGGQWSLVKEFIEVESGKRADRPMLEEAIRASRVYSAKLVIAKLDRLSRDAHFLLDLEKAGVDFVATNMPNANRLTVGIMAMVGGRGPMISQRTKVALAEAKRRGTRLGGDRGVKPSPEARGRALAATQARAEMRAADLFPVIAELQERDATSLRAIANGLTRGGIPTARGGSEWSALQVRRVLELVERGAERNRLNLVDLPEG